jgi:hypothetical protein
MAKGFKSGGRGKGVPNKLTGTRLAIATKALETGKSPLEIMLENMRHFQQVALDAEAILEGLTVEQMGGGKLEPEEQFKLLLAQAKKAAGLRQMAQECARDAAPYVHARLSAVTMQGDPERPIEAKLTVAFVSAHPE